MRLPASLVIAATLAACAPAIHSPPESGVPLRAELQVTERGLEVNVNQRAEVAVFAILPGTGTYAVYPRRGEVGRVFAPGSSGLRFDGQSGDLRELDQLKVVLNHRNTLLVLVAGRDLNVDPALRAGTAGDLRAVMGTEAYLAADANRSIARLAEMLAGDQPEQSWATDVKSVSPEALAFLTAGTLAGPGRTSGAGQ
ncbi:MAG TPA: hypothetical protein VF665_22760 [Longimicrobium sp.]|jgi:hypothetical protein|uniref:hypothetical protein n=1 Tax=Longimicrobium sp. TaxID=2029185 RepID=UPI002EDA2A74